jgi:hypothetical protein
MKAPSTKGLLARMALAAVVIISVMTVYPAHASETYYPGQNIGKLFQQGDNLARQNRGDMPQPPHEQPDAIGNVRPMAHFSDDNKLQSPAFNQNQGQ